MSDVSFFSGYRVLRIPKEKSADFLNLCAVYSFVYRELQPEEQFRLFSVSETVARKLILALESEQIPFACVKTGGLVHWLLRLGKRPGLILGALVFVFVLVWSSGVIWDIRVEGCDRLREYEVKQILHTCGLRQGLWRSHIDTASMEHRVMMESDEISWVSINIIGTVASVEIREAVARPETASNMTAANLVAERDGEIVRMENVRGNAAVGEGTVVSQGDLLVGGIYGSETDGFRYTVARGRVFAKTNRVFSVEIPLSYEKKVYTGQVKTEKYFIFFEKEVKFFGNSGNLYESCDTIDTVEYARVFSGEDLPIGIRTVRYLEYCTVSAQRTEAEAAALAEYEMKLLCEAELGDAELLSSEQRWHTDESGCRLRRFVTCIEDIAQTQEIELEGFAVADRSRKGGQNGTGDCQDRACGNDRKAVWQL